MGGSRVDGGSPQWRLHDGSARPAGKRQHWTSGRVKVLREQVDE
jgi:hypothetical protein